MSMDMQKNYKRQNTIKGWLYHIWLVILSMTQKPPYDNRR